MHSEYSYAKKTLFIFVFMQEFLDLQNSPFILVFRILWKTMWITWITLFIFTHFEYTFSLEQLYDVKVYIVFTKRSFIQKAADYALFLHSACG